jgi:hypothetical protein
VLVTVSCRVPPGPVLAALKATLTPALTILSVPVACR